MVGYRAAVRLVTDPHEQQEHRVTRAEGEGIFRPRDWAVGAKIFSAQNAIAPNVCNRSLLLALEDRPEQIKIFAGNCPT